MNASITGISSMATRQVLAAAADAWRQRGRGDVSFVSVGGVDAARRVLEGEPFDLVVLAADAIDRLVAAGRAVAGSKTDLARSEVAVAVRRGDPRPRIDTEPALREAVLAARSIGYSTGPSGVALQQLFERWGLAERVRGRLVQARPGIPVATLVARGEVALGFQQLSEMMDVEGIDVVGPMPPGTEILTMFSGAVCAASVQPGAGRALLEFLASAPSDVLWQRHGMQPARERAPT